MDSTETKDERKYNKESAETKEKKGAKNETKNKKAKQKIWAGREKERERENWRCGVQQLRDFRNPTNILWSCTFRYVVVILRTVLPFHTMDLPVFHLYSWNSLIARCIIYNLITIISGTANRRKRLTIKKWVHFGPLWLVRVIQKFFKLINHILNHFNSNILLLSIKYFNSTNYLY